MKKLLLALLVGIMLGSCSTDNSKVLDAIFSKSQTELIIEYSDDIITYDCEITINSKYTLKVKSMWGNHQYKFELTRFTDKEGNYFKPYATKVLNVFIYCQDARGENYFASGEFQ